MVGRRSLAAVALASLFGVLTPRVAQADAAKDAAEIAALEAQISLGAKALASGGCVVACRALSSMERAAERICALDPGPKCNDARARVKEASRRVQEACAECRSTKEEAPPPVRAAEPGSSPGTATALPTMPPPPPPKPSVQAEAPSDAPAPAPPAEVQKRGGCAGCAVSGDDARSGAALTALLVLAACARRRARARSRT